jgi:hypothetical protein
MFVIAMVLAAGWAFSVLCLLAYDLIKLMRMSREDRRHR